VTNFWTDGNPSGDFDYNTKFNLKGDLTPAFVRVKGKFPSSVATDRIAVFFDNMLPFNSVDKGSACDNNYN
jgi:hypothetical protein